MQGQCGGCCLRTAIFLTNKYSITMKKYKGTKVVSAEPMNEYDAVQKRIARPNTDNHEWREGYRVVYADGYESWSPKNVFEEAYSPIEISDEAKFTVAELIDFGNYLLSDKRKQTIESAENLNVVGDWDVQNWIDTPRDIE